MGNEQGPDRNCPDEIDEYLSKLNGDEKQTLETLRKDIRKIIPGVKERISYKIPVFRTKRDVIGFAATKKGLSIYTMSPELIKEFKNELSLYKISGTTIHFTPENLLPFDVLEKIINFKIKENGGE